jgi:hypothetical protein
MSDHRRSRPDLPVPRPRRSSSGWTGRGHPRAAGTPRSVEHLAAHGRLEDHRRRREGRDKDPEVPGRPPCTRRRSPGGYFVAGLTGLNTREGRPEGIRLIVSSVRPTRRHLKKLTAFEKKTGPTVLSHRHQCPTHLGHRRLGPQSVPGRPAPLECRGGGPGAHQQGQGTGRPALHLLGSEPRLDARREPRE